MGGFKQESVKFGPERHSKYMLYNEMVAFLVTMLM